MSITPDNGSKNKRRRYFANGRSRTIELSTLAEIDEEEYSKGVIEGVGPSSTTSTSISNSEQPSGTTTLTTQDDMCIGTLGSFKSLKRGSVKAQALKLSERLAQKVAAENAAKEEEQQQHHPQQNQQQHQHQQQPQNNQTSVKIRRSRTFDNTEFNAQEWQAQQQQQQQSQQSSTDFISAPPAARHPLSRSASFVTAPTPLIVYSMPAPPPPSAIPPQQQQQQQQQQHLSDRLSAALLDSRCESRLIGDYSMPLYYALPPPTPQNAPQPIFLPFIPPNYMDTKQQMFCLPYDIGPPPMMAGGPPTTNNIGGMRRKMKSAKRDEAATSWCSRICCAGLAQLLWTVVCIISFGIIASLILALCYM